MHDAFVAFERFDNPDGTPMTALQMDEIIRDMFLKSHSYLEEEYERMFMTEEPKFDYSGMSLAEQQLVNDMVNKPRHYMGRTLEVIHVIEDFNLGYNLGNALKYILRAGKKEHRGVDLKKAVWYLDREIKNAEQWGKDVR